jgi:hypothetical protein
MIPKMCPIVIPEITDPEACHAATSFSPWPLRNCPNRESLRDIETCLRSFSGTLYHMGFRSTIARSTLGDANESRDWRIYAGFAQSLIAIARRCMLDPIGVELNQGLYALDSTTIDLCLSLSLAGPNFASTRQQ